MALSERIKNARKQKHYTQKDLAQLLNVKSTAVSGWELGRNEPSIATLKKLANVLNVDFDYLAGVELPPKKKSSFDLKDNPHLLDMLSYNGRHLDDETKKMYLRLAKSQLFNENDNDSK